MKRKVFLAVSAVLLSAHLFFPVTASAFWPFDGWAKKGEVKGEQTDAKPQRGIFSKFTKSGPTPGTTPAVTQTEDQEEDALTEEKLTIAVRNRTITEAQRRELLSRLRAIKAKRDELKKLREALIAWLKQNNIDRKSLTEFKKETTPSVTPSRKPSVPPVRKNPGLERKPSNLGE